MKASDLRSVGLTAVAGSLLLWSGASPATLAAVPGPSPVQITNLQQTAGWLLAELTNTGRSTRSGTMVIEVQSRGRVQLVQQRFVVDGGNKVFVRWTSPDRRTKVIRAGVIFDDGAPF